MLVFLFAKKTVLALPVTGVPFCAQVKLGVSNLMTKLVAPASLVQAAIPDMIKNTPDSFFTKTMEVFENNASLCYSKLKGIPGLKPVMPEGALYMMVRRGPGLICITVGPHYDGTHYSGTPHNTATSDTGTPSELRMLCT